MKKIIVRLRGGLGNQLFIYAYARAIQESYNNIYMYLDLREYEKYKLRSYDLSKFNLNSNVKEFNNCDISWMKKLSYKITRNVYRLLVYCNKKMHIKSNKYLRYIFLKFGYLYNENEYYPISDLSNKNNIFIYGYFQHKKYADSIYTILGEEIKLKYKLSLEATKYEELIIDSSIAIAVSVRCGEDYIKLGWPICSMNYYKQGIQYIQNKYSKAHIYIFADELDKVKEAFQVSDDITFIEGCKGYEALYLMMLCDHFVIANSSYSWWGAYLSQYKDKIVVAPTYWYAKTQTKDTGLYFKNMILMNN